MTFSIAARDPEVGAFGVAVATGTVAVGATCPHVGERVAVLTQSFTKTAHGVDAVARTDTGEPVDTALESLLEADPYASYRQVHGIDGDGVTYTFTGEDCVATVGAVEGDHHTVAGNMLADEAVVSATAEAFEEAEGDLPGRLVTALEAGAAAGGDKRGVDSAALLVHAPTPTMYHNLRIDWADDPVDELRSVLAEARDAQSALREEVGDDVPEELLEFGIKY